MSNFYKVRLRRFSNDDGFTGQERDLKNLNRQVPNGDGRLSQGAQEALAADPDVQSNNRRFLDEVVIDVAPTIDENRAANYVDRPLQGPAGVVVYQHTNNRRFSINARFVSRTIVEAIFNYYAVNNLRSWLIPQAENGLSGRPPILRLNGYKQQFFNIPVVLTNLSINYPEDVDYIEAADLAMVPIVQNVSMELIESHRVSDIKLATSEVSDNTVDDFNLAQFKVGNLPGY